MGVKVHKFRIIIFLVFLTIEIHGQKPDSLFRSDEIIDIELRSDFSAIQNERTGEPVSHEGELIYSLGGKRMNLKVKIETRGYFRRDPSHCNFPPLTVNFKKNAVNGTLFENQDKIKLVTPCQEDHDVVDEYLVYKMYNKITDQSYNARLAKVLYYDTGNRKPLFTGYSFFIEHDDDLASRLKSEEDKKFITPFDLDQQSYIRLSLFEYMIGNKDWFVTSRKNILTLQPSDSTLKPVAVPYDFDLSSFVNASYTKPDGVPVSNLSKKRKYKGLCFSEGEFRNAFDYYKSMRPVFEDIIQNMELLPKQKRKENMAYLAEFYRLIDNFQSIISEFREDCETRKTYNLPEYDHYCSFYI